MSTITNYFFPTPNNSFWKALISAILIILVAHGLSSCVTMKQRERICKTCPQIIKDSTIYKETVKYDTTYLSKPGATLVIVNPCDSVGNLKPFTKTEKKNGVRATITSTNNVITVNCDTDSLIQVNKTLTLQKETYRRLSERYIEERSKMSIFFEICGQIAILCTFLYLGWRWVKYRFKV